MSAQGWYDQDGVFHEGPPPGAQTPAQQADANADVAAMQRQMEELQRQIQAAQQPAPTPEQQPASPEQQLADMQAQMAAMQMQLQQQTGPVQPLPTQPQQQAEVLQAVPVMPIQPETTVKGTGGLKALLAILSVLLVAALGAIVWVLVSGFSLANGLPAAEEDEAVAVTETVDVVLAPATAIGANAFATNQWGSGPNPALAQDATGEAPGGEPEAVEQVGGADAGLYTVPWGATYATGEAPSLLDELTAEPARAEAFVQALNSDPDLGWGGTLAAADLEAYLKQLSFVTLGADTWVTHHAYSAEAATATQAVLQKGSGVLIDRYGVPRVRVVSGDPLTAPEAGEGAGIVASTGKAWPDFDPSAVAIVAPSASVLDSFQLNADGATVEVSAQPCRGGGLGVACDPPSASANIVASPETPASVVIPTVTECAPTLVDGAPKVDFRFVNVSGTTLYMFEVQAGSCTVTQPQPKAIPNGYAGGWGSFGDGVLSEGLVFAVSDGISTTPLATFAAKNGAQIVD